MGWCEEKRVLGGGQGAQREDAGWGLGAGWGWRVLCWRVLAWEEVLAGCRVRLLSAPPFLPAPRNPAAAAPPRAAPLLPAVAGGSGPDPPPAGLAGAPVRMGSVSGWGGASREVPMWHPSSSSLHPVSSGTPRAPGVGWGGWEGRRSPRLEVVGITRMEMACRPFQGSL